MPRFTIYNSRFDLETFLVVFQISWISVYCSVNTSMEKKMEMIY